MIVLSLIARPFRNLAAKSASPVKVDNADEAEAGSPIRTVIIAAFQRILLRNNLGNSPGKMGVLRFRKSPSAPRESPKICPSAHHAQCSPEGRRPAFVQSHSTPPRATQLVVADQPRRERNTAAAFLARPRALPSSPIPIDSCTYPAFPMSRPPPSCHS